MTKQRGAERALAESEARAEHMRAFLAAIVESSNDAIVSKSLDGCINAWNAGAERLFGYSAHEAIGRPITLIIPPDRLEEEQDILQKVARGEAIEHVETVRIAKDGRRIDVSVTISPVRERDGRIVAISKVARDVSERKRMEQALQEADRRKDEFIAMLGHELRNPLAPIRNAAEVLRRTIPANAACERLCGILERQVQQMARLLDDLLDVTRIKRGTINFERQPTDLTSAVQRALEASGPLFEERRHDIEVRLPGGALPIEGDPVRLVQMLTNLLNNAAKYTPCGGHIAVSVVREADVYAIRVTDDGIGIRADMLSRIFELFVQADRPAREAHDGFGVGLSLVRVIAEHHGGTVEAASAGSGRGSEFIVRLPAAKPS